MLHLISAYAPPYLRKIVVHLVSFVPGLPGLTFLDSAAPGDLALSLSASSQNMHSTALCICIHKYMIHTRVHTCKYSSYVYDRVEM